MALRVLLAFLCLAANLMALRPLGAQHRVRHPRAGVIAAVAQDHLVWGPRAPEGREAVRLSEMQLGRAFRAERMVASDRADARRQMLRPLFTAPRWPIQVRRLLRPALTPRDPADPSD